MPKVKKYGINEFKYVPATIDYFSSYYSISREEIFTKALIKHSTMYNRLKNPEKFTLEEVSRIAKVIGISFNELVTGNAIKQQK